MLENKNKNKNINKPFQQSGLLGLYEVHSQSQSNPSFSLSEAQMKSIAVTQHPAFICLEFLSVKAILHLEFG